MIAGTPTINNNPINHRPVIGGHLFEALKLFARIYTGNICVVLWQCCGVLAFPPAASRYISEMPKKKKKKERKKTTFAVAPGLFRCLAAAQTHQFPQSRPTVQTGSYTQYDTVTTADLQNKAPDPLSM